MVRALQLLLGLILATGGGWFIWLRKDSPGGVFNVTDTETLWLVAMGLVLTLLGLVLFLMGLSPRAKVEQINWRYPAPAPEVDLSGPAFADTSVSTNSNTTSERPSWLQSAADELDNSTSERESDNNALGIAAAGAAALAGSAAASALSKSDTTPDTASDDPQYPRDELPFERPRFGARDVQDTSSVSLVDNPLSFDSPTPVESIEEPAPSSVDLPSTPEEEEQALEEINTAVDNDLADADIEALALEAAQASMEDGEELETDISNDLEAPTLANPELNEDPISYSSQEDDAFEAQLGALSPSVQAELSSQDIETPLPEAEVIPINSGEETEETVEPETDLAESNAPETESAEAELESVDLDIPKLDSTLEETLETSPTELNETVENVVEETETAIPVIEEPEELADISSLDKASLDLPELNEETLAEELPDTSQEEVATESVEAGTSLPEEAISSSESIETSDESEMDADEISATIDEFNAEIAGIAPTEELETPDLDLPDLEIPELEAAEVETPAIEATALADTDQDTKEVTETELASELATEDEISTEILESADDLKVEPLPELEEIPDIEDIAKPEAEIADPEVNPVELEALDLATSELDIPELDSGLEETQIEDLPSLAVKENELPTEVEELSADIDLPDVDLSTAQDLNSDPDNSQMSDITEVAARADADSPEQFEELPSDLELEPLEEVYVENDLPELEDSLPNLDELPTPDPIEPREDAQPLAASSSEGMNIQDLAAATMSGPTSGEMIADIAPPAPIEPRVEINPNGVAHPRLQPVRDALDANKLEEADSLLADIRRDLVQEGDENTPELAELTALAGDHAAASGRPGGAKWLWRLALQRFGEADAIESPAAKAVSERLRQFDN